MTNWLITQTTRFRVAVTGAGAVEHVANWGNDDTTFDDAYFLGGRPWEAQQRYHDEAAIFQIDKVKTPTHMVAGADDIRVAVTEDYLLDRALHSLGIPSTLLIFPGEGHSLKKNPWHGKIKVREELKGVGTAFLLAAVVGSGIMGEQYCLGVFACVQCLDYTSPLVFFPARNDRNFTILNESAQIVIAVEEGIPRQTIGTKPVTHQQVVVKHIRQDVRGSSQEPLHRDGVFRVTLYMFEQSG